MWARDLVYVGHMLDMAKKAVSKTTNFSRDAYDADENLRLALIHLVQVIGETGRRVSQEFSDSHPEIPWAEIIGMGRKVVHGHLGVDEDIVWQVVTEDSPKLVAALEPIRHRHRPMVRSTGIAGHRQLPPRWRRAGSENGRPSVNR